MKEKTNNLDQTLTEFLMSYDPKHYDQPSIVVDIALLLPENKVLLIKRKDHPNIDTWALPGGFMDIAENILSSAERELYEETNVKNLKLKPFGIYAEPTRDPRARLVSVAFYHDSANPDISYKAGDDAADARLFSWKYKSIGTIDIPDRVEVFHSISLPATALGQKIPASASAFDFLLENGETKISATIAVFADTTTCLVYSPALSRKNDEHLAGDHALMLFDALVSAGKTTL